MNRTFSSFPPLAIALSLFGIACELPRLPPGSGTPAETVTRPRQGDFQREDLDVFVRGFFEVDASYAPQTRAEARRSLNELTAHAGSLSDTLFVLRLSQIAALADNGHTNVTFRGSGAESGRVGVRLALFGDDFVVVQAAPENAGLLGGRLVSIDGAPIDQLRETARTLTGGVVSRRDQMASPFLESPGQLHALELARAPDQATYVLEMGDGETREVVLGVVSDPGTSDHSGLAVLSPETAPETWETLLPKDKAPWSLQDMGETMRRRDERRFNAILIQLRANRDGDRPLAEFLAEAEAARVKARRRHVILDMRMNGGGDLNTTRDWMSALPAHVAKNGRIAVLTGPSTFSAGISSVAYLKQAGGDRVILVGEAPGDRLQFFAEGQPVVLPNSQAVVSMATERHDYLTGCAEYTDCHGPIVEFPIAVSSLDPEIEAPWTLDAYVKGRDPGMEAAARALRRR